MADVPLPGEVCPILPQRAERVLLAHGGGGRLTNELLTQLFRPAFANPLLATEHDGAVFAAPATRLAFTSDAYVVRPLFFPGGDIGSLAIHGTVNDLAMCGARPLYLSATFVLEEGLPIQDLERIVASMQQAATQASVQIITGDTKVVDRGKGDGLYLAMSGIGGIDHTQVIEPRRVRPDDVVLLSGDIGRHGIAVLAAREGLGLEGVLPSDSAALYESVAALLATGVELHCLRDLTRGGLAAAVVEIAQTAGVTIALDERLIPVAEPVRGACELLGLDPLHVACEGRFLVFVPKEEAETALAAMQRMEVSTQACSIGKVTSGVAGQVTRITAVGSKRVLDLPSGEQLPRIC